MAFSTIGQGHHSFEASSSTSSSKSVSQPTFSIDKGSSSNLEAQQVDRRKLKNKLTDEVTAESCDPTSTRSSKLTLRNPTVQSSVPHPKTQKSAENSKSLPRNEIHEALHDNGGKQPIEEVFSTISQSIDGSQASSSSSPHDLVVEQVPRASTSSPSPNTMIQPKFSASEGSSTSGIPSESSVNQDLISLQSLIREVPTASSCSSSPKSVLKPKSSTGQGPLLNFDREEQIGESPSPRMSRTSLVESKMSLKEVSVESPNKTTMVSSNTTNNNKQEKTSDVTNFASSSTDKNEILVTPISASEQTSDKGNFEATKSVRFLQQRQIRIRSQS